MKKLHESMKDFLNEKDIKITPAEMEKLHSEGEIKKGDDTISYEEPENPTPTDESVNEKTGITLKELTKLDPDTYDQPVQMDVMKLLGAKDSNKVIIYDADSDGNSKEYKKYAKIKNWTRVKPKDAPQLTDATYGETWYNKKDNVIQTDSMGYVSYIALAESVNEGHDMTHPIEMENNRMMRSSAAEFTRYLTRKAHESRPENFIENGVQPVSERMPIKEDIENLPLNENPNRVYGMFTDDQGKPTKLDKELLDIALKGLPKKVVKNIDAVEANGYGKQNALSPHDASKKGVGTGSVAYHMIHIGLLKPIGPKKVQGITLGLRKRTSGPGTGYIYMKVQPDWQHNYGPDGEAATEFWMDNQHAAEKVRELSDNKFKSYLG